MARSYISRTGLATVESRHALKHLVKAARVRYRFGEHPGT
jgi:hypothetical protein